METTKHPKKVIFFSETIFSDRICNQILKNSNNTDIEIVSSEKVSEFENLLKDKNKSYLYRARVIIARLLVELMRYIAPNKADDIALQDHFNIYTVGWKSSKLFFFKVLIYLLRNSYLLRLLVHKILLILIPKDIINQSFKNFENCNIVVFSVGNLKSLSVLAFVAAAKKNSKCKSYTFIQSWDNPTTKGYGAFRTDFVLTWTELMRNEILLYQDISLNCSLSVGSPSLYTPSEILDSSHKATSENQSKQKIIFATKSPASYKSNIDIAEALALYSIEHDCELEVRIHPLCLLRKSNEFEDMAKLSEKYNFSLRHPKQNHSSLVLESGQDNLAVTSNINDILITVFSTMNIEAAYLGMKCINIDFATKEGQQFSPRVDIGIDRRQLHNKRILSYGYIYNVNSIKDLISNITKITSNSYNFSQMEDKRQLLVNKECSPMYDVSSFLKIIKG